MMRADMPRISASIICRDEEDDIRECLQSVAWCDEIVVVDSGSTDRTVAIAREFTDKVIHHDWPGYVAQVQYAMDQTTGDWIVCIDADERCTPELKEAILRAVAEPHDVVGFEVKRHVRYLGRWINHGGWYPDWKIRVVRRGQAHWKGRDPHYRLIPDGPTRRLDAEIIHRTYRGFSDQLETVNRFSDVFCERWMHQGRPFRLVMALLHPPLKFLSCYVWKLGFLDGWAGFVIAVTSAFYVFAKYVKLRDRLGAATQADGTARP